MRKEGFLIKAKHQAANEKSNSVLRQRSNFEGRQWFWVYVDKGTISGAGKHVLKAPVDGTTRKSFPLVSKLARWWTGPYYVLVVGPGKAPDGDLVGRNLLLLDMRHEDSRHINARVSVHRCKICYSPHEEGRRSNFLPRAMNGYVPNKYSDMSPPFHLTADDVNMKMDSYRATPGGIHRQSQVSPRIFWDGERVVYHLLGRNGKYFLGNGARFGTVQQCGGALLGE